ncbi:MAG: 6,7-dimethyl-8-ribityllumazine synthase [Polyangia bacterium]|jgi:6,7-dimethyl-8-ribityllumazine synthase|nr:6,7-dimethyl-8-ribityllumazine synthase [Polyangia bacterium]
MTHTIEGSLSASGLRIGLLVSRFNSFITERLLEGAMDQLLRSGAAAESITVVRVPGSFEMPGVLRRLADSGSFDAIVCLGAVIRGGTPHFDYVSSEVTKGIAHVVSEGKVAVGFGVLTTDTVEQAVERAGTKAGNKGAQAAIAAVEIANIYKQL